jgi:hypothetical protein
LLRRGCRRVDRERWRRPPRIDGGDELVPAPEFGPWEPLSLGATVDLFRAARFRWWIAGGRALEQSLHQNNLWARRAGGPWLLDITVGEGDDEAWIYRREERLRIPWEDAVLRTAAGVPYLSPELQPLFKSSNLRHKDLVDARQVIPGLSDQQRGRLARQLPDDHDWQALLPHGGKAVAS